MTAFVAVSDDVWVRGLVRFGFFALSLGACGRTGLLDLGLLGGPTDMAIADLTACEPQSLTLTHNKAPEMLILQDRSGSMNQDPDGNTLFIGDPRSKWSQMKNAIEQVVQSEQDVDWGLMMFPLDSLCAAPNSPDVPVGPSNANAITQALTDTIPVGGTPTADVVNNAARYFKQLADDHPHYLMLATDGEPNCMIGNADMNADDSFKAEQAISDAAQAGVHTFVIGIGNGFPDQVLSQMAVNGKEPNTAPGQKPYYSVSSTSDLVQVLDKIARGIVSCSMTLPGKPPYPDKVMVSDNGSAVARDTTHRNGWDFGPGGLSITFYGAACGTLLNQKNPTVQAMLGCP